MPIKISENQLQRELLAALPGRLPELRLYRRMVGMAEVRGAKVAFGIKGQCDLHGFTRSGRAVEVELKSATGSLSEYQTAWRDSLRGWGCAYFLLRGRKDEAIQDTIGRWIRELRSGLI